MLGNVQRIAAEVRLNDSLRARSRERALEIGERLLEIDNHQARGLAGAAGDALTFCALALSTSDSRYESAMHAAFKQSAHGDYPGSIGLFGGLSGLRGVAAFATAVEPRYRAVAQQCDGAVEEALPEDPEKPGGYAVFDLAAGWAGARLARGVDGAYAADALTPLLARIAGDWEWWRCPHPTYLTELHVNDLGVAHGVAGVLAAIALTHVTLEPELAHAVRRGAQRLANLATDRGAYLTWPHSLGRPPIERDRSAWCYGTPGVAASLYTVARALADGELAEFALRAQRAIALRPAGDWMVDEAGLCHGLLGNALCFASTARAANCDELQRAAQRCTGEALDLLDRSGGICAATNETNGLAGVALALLTLTGDTPSGWMLMHALKPL